MARQDLAWQVSMRVHSGHSKVFQCGPFLLALLSLLVSASVCADLSAESYAARPLYFEVNQGQAPTEVKYVSRGADYTLYLTSTSAQITLHSRQDVDASVQRRATVQITPVGIDVTASKPRAKLRGVDRLPGKSHYFTDNRSEHWVTGIEHFRKVVYSQIYPGIDMQFRSDSGRIEFDFLLEPSTDPERVRLKITGADHLKLDAAGNLRLSVDERELILRAPRSFQDINGSRQEIATYFVLQDSQTIGFSVAAYEQKQPLVIDPILDFSSYAGGSANDIAHGVAFDSQGNLYVVGETFSTDFPTHNPYQATSPVNGSAFVMKLDANTHDVVYATYVGSNVVEARGIAVDSAGSAYIVGDTASLTFPLMNPYQSSLHGLADIFVTKLAPTGNALAYSTYLGGSSVDRGRALAIDALGDVYIAGVTGSADFPLANAFQTRLRGSADAYVAKLSPVRGTLDYSTYLGGGGLDYGTAVAVDAAGQAFVGGYTDATNFPTLNPLQVAKAGSTDAFAARFTAQGGLAYATYLGGAGPDYAHAIAVDTAGNIHLAGQTESLNFPLSKPLQATAPGAGDAFAAKLNAAGSSLLYSTYLGGAKGDLAYGLRLDAAGNAYLTGQTTSNNFPTLHAVQPGNAGGQDAFVTALSPNGANLVYSTYFGGAANDYARAIAVDAGGNVAITGVTESDDLPRIDATQPLRGGSQDGFIALLLADDDDDDGLSNMLETALGTDPANPDSDADGLNDGAEVNQYATDPLLYDTDGDDLNDGQEVLVYGTSPTHSDTGDLAPRAAPDGQINLADLLVLMRYVAGLQAPDARAAALGDVDKDGALDLRDVLALRRMLSAM